MYIYIHFSYIHSYINYANLLWECTHRTYLRKINSQQKHALRLIHNRNRFCHSKELFESCKILNVYKAVYSIIQGLMAKPTDFLRVPPLSLLSKLSDFFLFWLVCYLVHFFNSIFVHSFIFLQSNCNYGYFYRSSSSIFWKVNIFFFFIIYCRN